MKWNYGEAGERWPVQAGDIWQVGEHVLACGDLEQGAAELVLQRVGQPSVVYCDPPWTPALATGFRTKAGVSRRVDFKALLRHVLAACTGCTGSVFMEMGREYVDTLATIAAELGGQEVARWSITYFRTRPAHLVQFSWSGAVRAATGLEGMDDEHTPQAAIAQAAMLGASVFDPCMGRGLTAVVAQRLGMRSVGIELAPRRMACTVDKLVRLTGLEPKVIGAL